MSKCYNADCTQKGIGECNGCKAVYCSRRCQKSHWPFHKHLCNKNISVKDLEIMTTKSLKMIPINDFSDVSC